MNTTEIIVEKQPGAPKLAYWLAAIALIRLRTLDYNQLGLKFYGRLITGFR